MNDFGTPSLFSKANFSMDIFGNDSIFHGDFFCVNDFGTPSFIFPNFWMDVFGNDFIFHGEFFPEEQTFSYGPFRPPVLVSSGHV
jgi:hypothetical protein